MSLTITKINSTFKIIVTELKFGKEIGIELKDTVLLHIDEPFELFELDLSATEYIDSAGIGKLLFLRKILENHQKSIAISKISIRLFDFLDSLNIPSILPITPPTPNRLATK